MAHFLWHCEGYAQERTRLRKDIESNCTCEPTEEEPDRINCLQFFDNLDVAGKAVFILGGPVDGRTPETEVDTWCAEFVRRIWKIRSQKLDAEFPDEGPTIDLTVSPPPVATKVLTDFFKTGPFLPPPPPSHHTRYIHHYYEHDY